MNNTEAYVDFRAARPGLLAGSLQLLGWVIFRPAAWAHHLRGIDGQLRPDFCLLELSREQWKKPALRRVVLQMCVLLPLLTLAVAQALYWLLSLLRHSPMLDAWVLLGYMLSGCLMMSAIISLPAGLTFGGVMAYGILFMSPDTPNITRVLAAAAAFCGSLQIGLNAFNGPPFTLKRLGRILLSVIVPILALLAAYGLIYWLVRPSGHQASLGAGVPGRFAALAGLGVIAPCSLLWAGGGYLRLRRWTPVLVAVSLAAGAATGLMLYYGLIAPTNSVALFLSAGLGGGLLFPLLFVLGYCVTARAGDSLAGGILGAFSGGLGWVPLGSIIFYPPIDMMGSIPPALLFILLGITFHLWRPIVEYPFLLLWTNILYYLERERPGRPPLLGLHPAFWDDFQYLPWAGLDGHLALLAERDPQQARLAFARLAGGRQAWAVRDAQAETAARQIARCHDVAGVAGLHATLMEEMLPGPASPILRQFVEISRDVYAALQQSDSLHTRALLGEARIRLRRLNEDLMISSLRPAQRFVPAVAHWLNILTLYLDQAARSERPAEGLPNPYIYAVPLDAGQATFVGRADVLARIEQAVLAPGYAPILLHGTRYMGKSSLLLNLGRALPQNVLLAYVDLKQSVGARDYGDLFLNFDQQIESSVLRQRGIRLPAAPMEGLQEHPLRTVNLWLDALETWLEGSGRTLLLKLDDVGVLNQLLARPQLPPDVLLNLLRSIMQHRTRLRVILASSRTPDEMQKWASYLINSLLLKLSYLRPEDARALIEQPLPGFALRYEPQAVEQVLALTNGHPYLVQRMCSELVTLKNMQPPGRRLLAEPQDVEAAAERVLERSNFFFMDVLNQVPPGAMPMLRALAGQGACLPAAEWRAVAAFPPDFDARLAALLKSGIVEQAPGGLRFQVELMRRWVVFRR